LVLCGPLYHIGGLYLFEAYAKIARIGGYYYPDDEDSAYLKIMDACLHHYTAFESRDNLLNAFELIRPLCFVYGGLAGFRLINACGKSSIMSYQRGKLSASLREFKNFFK